MCAPHENNEQRTQDNKADDMTWLESDREMTAEERYAHQKQQELLKKHADSLNAKYEAEHEATREQMEVREIRQHLPFLVSHTPAIHTHNRLTRTRAQRPSLLWRRRSRS